MPATKTKKNQLEFPIAFRHKNLIFNKNRQVWAVYRLSPRTLKLNNSSDYEDYMQNIVGLLNNRNVQYHIMVLPKSFNFQKYTDVANEKIVKGEFSDIGKQYFNRAGDILSDELELYEYDVYILVHLNKNANVITNDPVDLFKKFFKRLQEDISKVMTQEINVDDDLESYEQQEKHFFQQSSYREYLHRISEDEVDNIIYYMFHRTSDNFELPDTDYNLTEGVVQNHKGYLTIDHGEYREYVAFVPMIEMPGTIDNFSFIYDIYRKIDFPLEMQIRYDFKQQEQEERNVRKLKKRFENFNNEKTTMQTSDDDQIIEQAPERLENLLEDVKGNHRSVMYATFVAVISDSDKEQLERKISSLKTMLEKVDFKFVRPLVDQLTLFTQSFPASLYQYKYFEQPIDENYLAQAGLGLKEEVGNKYGMPLGKIVTNRQLKSVEEARNITNNIVFFNPLLAKKAIRNASHTTGNILITGPPGSGKSMLVKDFFTWSTFFGTKVLYIDPKNEFQRYYQSALEEHGDIEEFQELYNRINFVHLSEDPQFHGALDPLVFLEGDAALQTAISIFNTLAGRDRNRNENVSIHESVVQEMEEEENPTLSGALERLEAEQSILAKDIKRYNYGMGRMLFGYENSKGLDFNKQVNVLGMQGLDIPESDELTDEQTISVCLLMSISKYVNIFSRDPNEEAMIIFDESWLLNKAKEGEKLIEEMLRTGRSLRTDVVLVTQSYEDVNSDKIKDQLGVRFAFRPVNEKGIDPLIEFFDLELNEANRKVVKNLRQGMCLYQDLFGRTQAIAIDVMFEEWTKAMRTTKKDEASVELEEAHA